jgi:hypothetical protein
MRAALLIVPVLSWLVLSGCFLQHASPGEKLSKSVQELNKSARWGQIGAAAQMVDASYRQQFLASHRHWGRTLQVADTELVHMEVAAGNESAIAVIAYSWYSTDAMTLHASLVRQRWLAEDQTFALISETVIDGDTRLLGGASSPNNGGQAVQPMADPFGADDLTGAGVGVGMGMHNDG